MFSLFLTSLNYAAQRTVIKDKEKKMKNDAQHNLCDDKNNLDRHTHFFDKPYFLYFNIFFSFLTKQEIEKI